MASSSLRSRVLASPDRLQSLQAQEDAPSLVGWGIDIVEFLNMEQRSRFPSGMTNEGKVTSARR
jgi:hypothetical protein